MSDIFLSYDRDDRERAARLAKAMEARGWSVWWDVDIPPGKTFDQVIEEALAETRCVVVLWSESSVRSDWVKTEASEGRDRGILVPVLIDPVKIPLAFRRIQAADLVDWFATGEDEDMRLFERAVEDLVGQRGSGETAPGPRPTPSPVREASGRGRRELIIAGVLVALALLALFVIPKLLRKPPRRDGRPAADGAAVESTVVEDPDVADAGPAARPEPSTERTAGDVARGEVRPAIFRVEIAPGRFGSHGFVASQGYLIAMSQGIGEEDRVTVTLREGGERTRAIAKVVRRGPQMTLLRLANRSPPGRDPMIRSSISLSPGDQIERYLGPTDSTPGRVREVAAEREVWVSADRPAMKIRALITTNISASGDAGAPVLDKEGRIVAVVYGGSSTETISVPIEQLRNAFPEAF